MSNPCPNISMPKVILTCFAGRRRNMELLLMYADELHSRGLIDEMHIWDFSRNNKDSSWLEKNFQKSPFLSTREYEYRPTGMFLKEGEESRVLFRGSSNAHVLIGKSWAEVSLGAYGNSCSFLRDGMQGRNVSVRGGSVCDSRSWMSIGLLARGRSLEVRLDGELILQGDLKDPSFPMEIKVASWKGEEMDWRVESRQETNRKHPCARLFKVRDKGNWREYYQHYTSQLYPDSVIIKSDDDIVFIDLKSFEEFIRCRVEDKNSLLLFPGIVNNGVCARHQAETGIMPKNMGAFKGEGSTDSLWRDGKLCQRMHRSFTEDNKGWIERARNTKGTIKVPIGERVSINFFAIRSDDLYVFKMLGNDDERDITMEVPRKIGRYNSIKLSTTVAHLSFYRQRETGLNEKETVSMYRRLACELLGKRWEGKIF